MCFQFGIPKLKLHCQNRNGSCVCEEGGVVDIFFQKITLIHGFDDVDMKKLNYEE